MEGTPSSVVRLSAACSRPWVKDGKSLASEYSRHALETLVGAGQVVALARDVYAPLLFSQDLRTRARAATMCVGGGAVSGLAGLFYNRAIDEAPRQALIVIGRHHHVLRRAPGVVIYRATRQPPTWRIDGVDVAEPEWCLLHAMREVAKRDRVDLGIKALATDAVSAAALLEILDLHTRAVGRRELREAVSLHLQGIESPLERRGMQDVMTGAEFADFERQVDLVADGKPYRVDAVHLEARLIVEFDGKRNHLRPDRVLYDRKRDVRLASEGFLTLRFTGREVLADPEWCRRMILAVLAHRLSIPDRA